MRVKNLLLVVVAALATTLPAKADVLLGFRLLDPLVAPVSPNDAISDSYLLSDGLPTTGLVMTPGQVQYVMMTIRSTNTNVSPAQAVWYAPFRLTTAGWNLTFDQNIVNNPYINVPPPGSNDSNLFFQTPYGGDVFPQGASGYPAGYRQAVGLSTAGIRQPGTAPNAAILVERPLAVFKVVAGGPGSTALVISPLTSGPGGPVQQNLWEVSENVPATNQYLDNTIFNAALGHGTYSLPVTVVPEPSSMALAGLAVVGFGWRKLRRKKA
jgi:hypothetical protein